MTSDRRPIRHAPIVHELNRFAIYELFSADPLSPSSLVPPPNSAEPALIINTLGRAQVFFEAGFASHAT